ncbi:hypothetical protein GN244_ATG00496 [Phytophthora infestans]|uniref:Cleavage/polyadenylation specificity factor A subunit C-terminal domain-containing protein n=1 Tax=Phytophthora infestans TaxID=4787 RepID=A0A833WP76_PHYIN|nr:hypothetical protein GN244_ATG00496 [Phytophthora infestans]
MCTTDREPSPWSRSSARTCLAAVGSKLIVYEFKSEQLIGCVVYDSADLVLLAKDYKPVEVSATVFSVFEKKLALLAVDRDENLHVMQLAPQNYRVSR